MVEPNVDRVPSAHARIRETGDVFNEYQLVKQTNAVNKAKKHITFFLN